MPLNPLDMLKSLHLFDPKGPKVPQVVQDAKAEMEQQDDPAWMKAGRSAVDGIVGFTKGALGIGDQGPSGPTATNLGQVLAAGLPMINGLKGAGLKGMYSRVDAAAEQLPSALHPSKAEGIFRNNAAKEEVDYRGLSDFLKSNQGPKVTKAEIQSHLDAHPMPEIGVKDLGGEGAGKPKSGTLYDWEGPSPVKYDRPSLNVPGGQNYKERLLTLPEKFDNPELSDADFQDWHYKHYAQHTDQTIEDLRRDDPQMLIRYGNDRNKQVMEPQFQSSHWDEPNVLAHSRFDERTLGEQVAPKWRVEPNNSTETVTHAQEYPWHVVDAQTGEGQFWTPTEQDAHDWIQRDPFNDNHPRASNFNERPVGGDKGRFLQEVQSDWHQQGKEHGYESDYLPFPSPDDHANAFNARDAIRQELLDKHQHNLGTIPPNAPTARVIDGLRMAGAAPEDIARLEQAQAHLERVHNLIGGGKREGVPDAPFKETWPDLVMKEHVLDVANNPDLNWLGFTTGDTQNKRYDLTKHVSKIEWEPHNSTHAPEKTAASGNGLLWTYDKDGTPINPGISMHQSEVANHIGRELADRLFGGENAERLSFGVGPYLEGVNLEMGGEGMKHFYDKKLPSALSKILKPFGGKVELGEVPIPRPKFDVRAVRHEGDVTGWEGQLMANGQHIASAVPMTEPGPGAAPGARGTADDLIELVRKNPSLNKTAPAWIAHLPPEMKKAIMEKGLPLLTLLGMSQANQSDSTPQGAMKGLKDAR